MSESPSVSRSFFLDHEPLGADYDDEADVLYLWRGEEPGEGVGLTTDDGILIRFHPETGEVVGFTIVDWAARWADCDVIEIIVPAVGANQPHNGAGPTRRVLASAVPTP
jgi:uncharacterized protein YuzE